MTEIRNASLSLENEESQVSPSSKQIKDEEYKVNNDSTNSSSNNSPTNAHHNNIHQNTNYNEKEEELNNQNSQHNTSSKEFSPSKNNNKDTDSTAEKQVRTLFLSGLPHDVTEREIYLLLRPHDGFQSAVIKYSGKQIRENPISFATFTDHESAMNAMKALQGVYFDPDKRFKVRIEPAKNNTKAKRTRSISSDWMESAEKRFKVDAGITGYTGPKYAPPTPTASTWHGYYGDAGVSPMWSTPSYPPAPSYPSAYPAPYSPPSYVSPEPPIANVSGAPCNTLFICNLAPETSEMEIRDLFSQCPGFCRLKFTRTGSNPVCFVEFTNVGLASQASANIQGYILPSTNRPIRIEFAKKSMGSPSRKYGSPRS